MSINFNDNLEIQKAFQSLLENKTQTEKIEKIKNNLVQQFFSEIEFACEEMNLNKKDLADKSGVSSSFITQLFTGVKTPSFKIIARMVDALDIKFSIKRDKYLHQNVDFEYYKKINSMSNINRFMNYSDNMLMFDYNDDYDELMKQDKLKNQHLKVA